LSEADHHSRLKSISTLARNRSVFLRHIDHFLRSARTVIDFSRNPQPAKPVL